MAPPGLSNFTNSTNTDRLALTKWSELAITMPSSGGKFSQVAAERQQGSLAVIYRINLAARLEHCCQKIGKDPFPAAQVGPNAAGRTYRGTQQQLGFTQPAIVLFEPALQLSAQPLSDLARFSL